MAEKIVLAYSGGLDTSVAAHWLRVQRGYEVSLPDDRPRQPRRPRGHPRARATGRRRGRGHRGRQGGLPPLLRLPRPAGRRRVRGPLPLATALGRPLIAKLLVDNAREIGATAVAHGCPGKVQRPGAPGCGRPDARPRPQDRRHHARALVSRPEALEYAAANGINVRQSKESPYSTDENLWGRSI